jgi:[ribosomal protein S5]-alanine N-acetyltransferase
MFEAIETERLRIRDVVLSDRDAFHAYMKRENYWRHVPIEPPTLEWVETLVKNCVREQDRDPRTHYFLAAVSKQTETVVGEAILRIESLRHGQGEIGWGVDSEHTGHGLGTEIGRAMLRLGFDLGLHRLYARCRVQNVASLRIMAKLGMSEEGTLRENVSARGEWWSSAQWSVLRTDVR